VFIISGVPYLAMSSFKASTQKLASSVFDSRQIEEPAPHRDVGNVTTPDVVCARDLPLS
jgi:hypothetical protein